MTPEESNRLDILRQKFDSEGAASFSQAEGEEFVRLMRAEAALAASAKRTKKASSSSSKPSKTAPAPSVADFMARLEALKAGKK